MIDELSNQCIFFGFFMIKLFFELFSKFEIVNVKQKKNSQLIKLYEFMLKDVYLIKMIYDFRFMVK